MADWVCAVMNTAKEKSPYTNLTGASVLVLPSEQTSFLQHGTMLAQVGAFVIVSKGPDNALHEIRSRQGQFAVALIGWSVDDSLKEVVYTLRHAKHPSFCVGCFPEQRIQAARELTQAGVTELVSTAATTHATLMALHRTAELTRRIRMTMLGHDDSSDGSGPAPVAAAALSPLPRGSVRESAFDTLPMLSLFTAREQAVFLLLAQGGRFVDIGIELNMAPRTVKMHVFNMRAKTGAKNRLELIRMVYQGRS